MRTGPFSPTSQRACVVVDLRRQYLAHVRLGALLAMTVSLNIDDWLMLQALDEARRAGRNNEAPVGAVVFDPDRVDPGALDHVTEEHLKAGVVARGANGSIAAHDPTAHAEIVALRAAAGAVGNYRLTGLWLAVTLEPCAMCAGAMSHARIGRLIYGASDPKGGAVEHGPRLFEQPTLHWRPQVTSGVRAEECAELLRSFFRARRSKPAKT